MLLFKRLIDENQLRLVLRLHSTPLLVVVLTLWFVVFQVEPIQHFDWPIVEDKLPQNGNWQNFKDWTGLAQFFATKNRQFCFIIYELKANTDYGLIILKT